MDTDETKLARVETSDETAIGYVAFPNAKQPKFIQDEQGRLYEAQLDDFCTFAGYREVAVTKVKLMTATGPDVPVWGEVWQHIVTGEKFVVRSDEKIREIMSSQDYKFVVKHAHSEPKPDFSYVCFFPHCRCQD